MSYLKPSFSRPFGLEAVRVVPPTVGRRVRRERDAHSVPLETATTQPRPLPHLRNLRTTRAESETGSPIEAGRIAQAVALSMDDKAALR